MTSRQATGRIVRWDGGAGAGAVVVASLASEISVGADAVDDEGWDPEVGDLVAVAYVCGDHGLRATSVHLTEPDD